MVTVLQMVTLYRWLKAVAEVKRGKDSECSSAIFPLAMYNSPMFLLKVHPQCTLC